MMDAPIGGNREVAEAGVTARHPHSTSALSLSAFRRMILGAIGLWTAAVLLSFAVQSENERRQALDLAIHEARASLETDIGFRRWATSHGGVYVAPDDRTPPNPYLDVPDRDVETTSGKRLTLMNPAYMLRQLMQQGYVARGRITSMQPLNPGNAPDAWEIHALGHLEAGDSEIAEAIQVDGKPAVRMMLPILVEEGCLKCHGHQGYSTGDLRGGIDVIVALEPFQANAAVEIRWLAVNHGLIWLLVAAGIMLVWRGGSLHIRRQAEAEEKLLITQFSVDRAEVAVYWLSPSGRFSYVNRAACLLLGYGAEELLALHASDLNPAHPPDQWAEHMAMLKSTGFSRFETALRHKDGHMVPVEISANYLAYKGKEFDVAFVRDLREHKAAQARIDHLTDVYAALSQTNQCIVRCQSRTELFESIVKIAIDHGRFKMAWIGMVDEETQEVRLTAQAGEGFGYLDGLTVSAAADSPYGQGPCGRSIRSGTYCIAEDFIGADTTAPWHERALAFGFRSSAAFPLNNRGRTAGTLSLYSEEPNFFTPELIELLSEMSSDISFALDRMDLEASHQRQEDERREMLERLMASNTELERFAYVASHDLQEPLRTIVSFSQLVERRVVATLSPEDRENFSFVIDAAKRMNLLINDLLAFSRVSAKGASYARLSLAAACAAAIDNLREAVSQSGAAITVGDLPEVMGDEIQVMQIFQNLIGNAIKFRHAERPPRIAIAAERQEGKWMISVADNGIGIADTTQDIFEIFRRLHPGHHYPGSGVGLAICKRIVTQHGGRIWVESKPGQGATFRFTLPVEMKPLDGV